ncbi:hypothetical protein R3P38DRAFT_2566118, partial [Favolaschia claudopus]
KRFGLWLHLGMDPFTGRIEWVKIWWSNRNSKLVTSYDACREIDGVFVVRKLNVAHTLCLGIPMISLGQRTLA